MCNTILNNLQPWQRKKSYIPIIATIVVAIGLIKLANQQSSVGAMDDAPVALENLKRGIANGWYKAQLTIVNGQQAVHLSGKLINGREYSDVYPITPEVAAELKQMGVPTV